MIRMNLLIDKLTIEDIFNPIDVIKFLTKISKRGYIAIPSKYNEFKHLYGNAYRGKGDYVRAIEQYECALKIFISTLGESHPITVATKDNIKNTRQEMNQGKKRASCCIIL